MQILMPQLNDAGDPGSVHEIFVAVGDLVSVGQAVMAVEMEKAIIEIEATEAGTVARDRRAGGRRGRRRSTPDSNWNEAMDFSPASTGSRCMARWCSSGCSS